MSQDIIQAFALGRQIKQAHDDAIRQQQLDAERTADRQMQQEVLKHQLAKLKLEDRLTARDVAKQNFDMVNGQPFDQIAQPLQEGEVPGAGATTGIPAAMDGTVPQQRVVRPMTMPGIQELGIGDTQVTPQSMEQVLAGRMAESRRKAIETPFDLSPGQHRFAPGASGGVEDVASVPAVAPKITYTLETAFVNGRRDFINKGSDGQFYRPGTNIPVDPKFVKPIPEKDATVKPTDDAELPRGVTDYLYKISQEFGQDFDGARQKVAATFDQLRKDHPRLDATKVDDALRKLFRPAPGAAGSELAQIIAAALPGAAGPASAAPASAAARSQPSPAKPAATSGRTPPVQVGQVVTVKGKQYTIGKVYPDGTWDPK